MFLSRNKKNNAYPCKPQFYYIKVALALVCCLGFSMKGLPIKSICYRARKENQDFCPPSWNLVSQEKMEDGDSQVLMDSQVSLENLVTQDEMASQDLMVTIIGIS